MTVGIINVLPFDSRLGLDQQQGMTVNGVAYALMYRYNQYSGFRTLEISRQTDGVVVWSGKLVEFWGGIAKDPDSHVDLFAIGVRYLSDSDMEIQIYAPTI